MELLPIKEISAFRNRVFEVMMGDDPRREEKGILRQMRITSKILSVIPCVVEDTIYSQTILFQGVKKVTIKYKKNAIFVISTAGRSLYGDTLKQIICKKKKGNMRAHSMTSWE